jgi:site-specific recombinase XerD
MRAFESFLAPQLKEFIAYREMLGYSKNQNISRLFTFDRYLKEKKQEETQLDPSFFLEFRAHLKMEAASINKILFTTRIFFQFLVRKGLYQTNPLQDLPLFRENAVVPFVFSPQQIDRLLDAVCRRIRRDEKYFAVDLAGYLAIVLLARCGMRITEPLRMLRTHYRADEATLYIEKTKFKKDRLIPVPKAVGTEIENYLALRKSLCPDDRNPYLLAAREENLNDQFIRRRFHKALKDIGLNQKRQVIGNVNFSSPTPHSLRHSFAINTLKRIKEQGKSPQKVLPVLAAYMGHSEYKYTAKYLKFLDAQQRKQLFGFIHLRYRNET